MPSEPRRTSRKSLILRHRMRSASSDTGSASHGNLTGRSPVRLSSFWRRKRVVTPAAVRSFVVAEQQSTATHTENDVNDNVVILNNPTEYKLRWYFSAKQRSFTTRDRLERSVISQSSVSSSRSHRGFASVETSLKGETPFGTKQEAMNSSADGLVVKSAIKPQRRLRAKEELCIVLPRSTTRGRTTSQKSWFLGPGIIGREPAEGTLVVTRDQSMDAVHAEISVVGDDYFVRDAQSATGTFLCLSTRYRHYPQRDGYRLRRGDVFRIGPATSIRVVDLQTTTDSTPIRCGSSKLVLTAEQPASQDANHAHAKVERTLSTNANKTSQLTLKPMSTMEELRLLAADIEDELMNDAGRRHSTTPRYKVVDSDDGNKDNLQTSTPAAPTLQRSVRFSATPPVMSDGSVFLGSRYLRPEVKELHYHEPSQVEDDDDDMIKQLIGSEHDSSLVGHSPSSSTKTRRPASIHLVIFQHDPTKASAEPLNSRDARDVTLAGQETYLIGSSAACDVRIFPSEGIEIRAVHARIMFDGVAFVLQDVSFERDLRRQTRVLVTQRPVRITRGDWLLLGKCALYVTTVVRAFSSGRRSDMKEAAMRLDVLRLSKRKPRTKRLFVPVGFRLYSARGSGASSGSSGWGGSSGGPVTFGKGRDCDAQVFTASLATEQFSVQLERGTCLLSPKPTGINAGTYFLIGRDEIGPPLLEIGADNTDADATKELEIVKHTSKPLLLSEGCVFRCGGCEMEVIYVKSFAAIDELRNIQFLSAIPWLKPIASDVKTVANLARCGQRLKLNSGDLIYEKNDVASFVFIVISGEVALHMTTGNDGTEENNIDTQVQIEHVTAGGFFGEVSVYDPLELSASMPNSDDLEYPETARAASTCELLALAKEDVCGYLGLHMDIVRAHLRHDRSRDNVIRVACSNVPWLRGISLQEMRILSVRAEVAVYPPGSILFEDGKLFVSATFAGGNTFQLRDGLLVLSRGNARVVRSKHERQKRRKMKYHANNLEDEHRGLESVHSVEDNETDNEPDEWWSPKEPVIAMSSSLIQSELTFCALSFRLEAYSSVECYFIAAAHLAHLNVGMAAKQLENPSPCPEAPTDAHIPPPLKRGNSLVGRRRMHHSQVVTSALHNGGSNSDDDDHNTLDGSDGEGDTTAARRWRRKKRNKHLLDQTVLETQNDAETPNALVLYVLAGAKRGDIHVVRNVASIGGLLSGADIELNDRYVSRMHAAIEYHDGRYWLYDNGSKWGTFVRLEEDKAVDINPGDVFLAGEIEFTCLASYPERNKPSLCCIM